MLQVALHSRFRPAGVDRHAQDNIALWRLPRDEARTRRGGPACMAASIPLGGPLGVEPHSVPLIARARAKSWLYGPKP